MCLWKKKKNIKQKLSTVKCSTDTTFHLNLNASKELKDIDDSALTSLKALTAIDQNVKILNAYEHLVSLSVKKTI